MNNVTVVRGDTWDFTVTLVDPNGDPYDLTDCELTFTVEGLVSKTLGAGITIDPDGDPAPDPETGIAGITLDAGDTSAAPDRRTAYPYDVQLTTSTGEVRTPIRGLFIVVPDVTI